MRSSGARHSISARERGAHAMPVRCSWNAAAVHALRARMRARSGIVAETSSVPHGIASTSGRMLAVAPLDAAAEAARARTARASRARAQPPATSGIPASGITARFATGKSSIRRWSLGASGMTARLATGKSSMASWPEAESDVLPESFVGPGRRRRAPAGRDEARRRHVRHRRDAERRDEELPRLPAPVAHASMIAPARGRGQAGAFSDRRAWRRPGQRRSSSPGRGSAGRG